MITKVQLIDAFTEEIKMDPARRINSEPLIMRNINAAQRKVQADSNYRSPDSLKVLTFPNVNDYVLPEDFLGVADPKSVTADGTLLEPANYVDLLGTVDLTAGGGASAFYLKKVNEQWLFNTYPQSPGSTIVLPYLSGLPEITDIQPCVLPEKYLNPIVYYAIYLTLKRIVGYEQKAAEYMGYYEEAKNQLLVIDLATNRAALKFGTPRGRTRQYKWF